MRWFGGTGEMPSAGTTFSGVHGATLEDATSRVPHATIRSTTAGAVRDTGGTVKSAPELTRSGVMNDKHVNVSGVRTSPPRFPSRNRIQSRRRTASSNGYRRCKPRCGVL